MKTPILVALAASVFNLLATSRVAAAECGGGLAPLSRTVQGQYIIVFAAAPSPTAVGEARLIVDICDATTGQPVRDLAVTLVPIAPGGRQGARIYAFNRTSTPGEYSADVTYKEPGTWRYQVSVDGPQGHATSEAAITVAGEHPGDASGLVFLGTSAVLALGAALLVVRGRWRPAAAPHAP